MLKSRFIRRRQRSKSADKQLPAPSENVIEPPEQFGNTPAEEEDLPASNTADADMKLKKSDKKDAESKHKKTGSSDDYGFLSFPRSGVNCHPKITIRHHSPKSEIEYFDDSLFDIGFLQSTQDSIPITLGSISNTTSQPDSAADSNQSSEMPVNAAPLPYQVSRHRKESHYVNAEALSKKCYDEQAEGHYARLSEVNKNNEPSTNNRSKNELNFYIQKAAEQRARTRSRGPECRQRSRSRSTHKKEARCHSRGRSASRDIMALYTNRPVSGCRLRQQSTSPERDSISHLRRRQSVSPDAQNNKRNGRSKKTAVSNNRNVMERKSSGTETGSKTNFTDSALPVGKHASTPIKETNVDDCTSSMTILEMDVEKNIQIEKDLVQANSLKPADIKMMVIAHHAPSANWASKDEIPVKAGDVVTGIYKQNQWLYVKTESNKVGFVPYAITKPVKVTDSLKHGSSVKPTKSAGTTKPVNSILKTSNCNKHKLRKSHPKYSVKVRMAADNDSLSSESGSAITEDFVYTRKIVSTARSHADCIVIDTDDISPGFERSANSEETNTYCSDSGISDPSSNHSEDIDSLHSPLSLTDGQHDSGFNISNSTPRLANERIVSVTTELLAHSPYNSMKSTKDMATKSRYIGSDTISDMPLGPLGARLAKLNMNDKAEATKCVNMLDNDTRDRAKSSGTTPSLRPEIPKDYNGPRVTVVFDYEGGNQDDLIVHASDIVTVLNSEDIEWIWVQRRDGKEGFIPREYVIPLELSAQNRRRVGISLL